MLSPGQKNGHISVPDFAFPTVSRPSLLLASDMARLCTQVVRNKTEKTNPLGIFLLGSLQSDSFPLCHIHIYLLYSFLIHLEDFKLLNFLSRSFSVQGSDQILYRLAGILQ